MILNKQPLAKNDSSFQLDFLKPKEKDKYSSPYDFLKECRYEVELNKLYTLESTCHYHEGMPYCPVILKISPDIKDFCYRKSDASYLLQVWTRTQKKVYEVELQKPINAWNIYYDYFIYKPEDPDENHDYFHIVNLRKMNDEGMCSVQLIGDFVRDPSYKYFSYVDSIFYIASSDEIKFFDLKDEMEVGESITIESDKLDIYTISKEQLGTMTVHGLFSQSQEHKFVIIALETTENLIDFNQLEVTEDPDTERLTFKFKQHREIVSRPEVKFDPIMKFCQKISSTQDGFMTYAVALRKSGNADFYFNMSRVASYEVNPQFQMIQNQATQQVDYSKKIVNVECSFEQTYLKFDCPPKTQNLIRAINHKLEARVSIEETEVIDKYKFENIYYQTVKSYCKIFSSYVFVGTKIFVSHGKILTLFDVQKKDKKISENIIFEREIMNVFRSSNGQGGFDIVVMLARGLIQIVSKEDDGKYSLNNILSWELQEQLQGYYIQHDSDHDDNQYALIMTSLDQKGRLYCYHHRRMYDVTTQILQVADQNIQLSEKSNMIFMFSEASNSTRFLLQDSNSVQMFSIMIPNVLKKPEEEKKSAFKMLPNRNLIQENDGKEEIQPVIRKLWSVTDLKIISNNYQSMDGLELKVKLFTQRFHSSIAIMDKNEKKMFKNGAQDEETIKKINEFYLFFDKAHIYMFNKRTNQFRPFENQNIQGLFFSDYNYLYTLSAKRPKQNIGSSFRIYDLWNFITAAGQDDLSYELTPVQVGSQSLIDFSEVNQRFVYQSSFDYLEILPVLHRNSIYFMGMQDRNFYLSTRVINDQFIALDRNNQLTTWNIVTGKVLREYSVSKRNINEVSDYSKFNIFKYNDSNHTYEREWYQKTLLMTQDDLPEDEVDESKFYNPDDLVKTLPGQIPFVKTLAKHYHEFRLIQIESPTEVKELASFVYPHWQGKTQYMYFNDDASMMFEGLFLERYQIYKRIYLQGNTCRWELNRRLPNFSGNLFTSISQYPFYMSPNFAQYLDIDIINKQYVIKDTLNQNIVHNIPQWLMKYSEGQKGETEKRDILQRFKWRDNSHIQVVNNEGIEKVVSLIENFKEVAFYTIPLYQPNPNHHYYNQKALDTVDTVERLKKKYQSYKQATLLDKQFNNYTRRNSEPENLYSRLFTVDYQILDELDENKFDRHIVDQSFTFFHWSLMEQLRTGRLQVSQINEEQIQCLIYNILPQGLTVLHLLQQNTNVLEALYDVCHKFNDQQKKLIARMHLPFLINFQQKSPLDTLIDKNDVRIVDKVLYNLQPYGIDHHSREIKDQFSYFVESKLPSINGYLTSRIIQTKYLQIVDKGTVMPNPAQGISMASYWINDAEKNQVWTSGTEEKEKEVEIRIEYIDIAGPHDFRNQDSSKFFEALANCNDMTIFNEVAIMKMIDFKWVLAKKYTIRKLLFPYLAFMFIYLLYMNWFYLIRFTKPWYFFIDIFFVGLQGLFSAYFISMEIKQLRNEGWNYLSSVWNYLDLIPPFTLAVFLPMEILGMFDYQESMNQYIAKQRLANFFNQTLVDPTVSLRTIEGVMQSIISLIFWLKLLYFLRIFKKTGYYIRTIIEVIADIKYFLLMLLLTIVAFGDSMRQISESNQPANVFMGQNIFAAVGFVYRMVLGDFDTTQFGSVSVGYVWILFIICTLFNLIIMLNLLIAIISESFSRVTSVSQEAGYREMADLIAENTYLIPEEENANFCPENKYMIIATDIQQEIANVVSFDDQMEQVVQKIFTQTGDSQSKLLFRMGQSQKRSEDLFIEKSKEINSKRDKIISLVDQIRVQNSTLRRF